ncbi:MULTISPECIES: pentapeptide repeat-containing protein [unclassified Streptomyces]|uniref:pentapeptide repeat-containing protein n=1 Tax=unclassified Streptomyces TaxID=2593676 RepID=UPI0035DE792F
MTHLASFSPSVPPPWPHCAQGATQEDPVGCQGIQITGGTACLAHVTHDSRVAYLATLSPGDNIDFRGTSFTEGLLADLLAALREPTTGIPSIGFAQFGSATFDDAASFTAATFWGGAMFEAATFTGPADFRRATFKNTARFGLATFKSSARFESVTVRHEAGFQSATFHGAARFRSATFESEARFGSATFEDSAWFGSAIFGHDAWFGSAVFRHDARFGSARFSRDAKFGSVTFSRDTVFNRATFSRDAVFDASAFEGDAWFNSAIFAGTAIFRAATFKDVAGFEAARFARDAEFTSAAFKEAVTLGPFVCEGRVILSGATFGGPATLAFAVRRLECRRTRWSSTAELRLRFATVDFAHAVFEYPLTLAGELAPFALSDGAVVEEQSLSRAPDTRVRLTSLRGVDAAHLVLADVDLSRCLFTGTVHLDQLRLEGDCTFSLPPHTPWWHWYRGYFTPRRTLAEEHHWRARQPSAARGWNTAVLGAGNVRPVQLAPVYRALRKAFEDGKHEPGAADFYYGEMEMRRNAHDIRRSERFLLTSYWALSGYGLRASRALGWLAAAMLVTIMLLLGFGLPQEDPKQEATGTVPAGGGKVTFEIDKNDPRNPTGDRFTGERFEKALNVTLNSVVFRSSGQDLTTAGTYIEMTSRVTEPILLGLAVLAVRNRVKR